MPTQPHGWSLSRKQLAWTAVGAVATTATVLLAVAWRPDGANGTSNTADHGASIEDNDVAAGGDVDQSVVNNYNDFTDQAAATSNAGEIRALAEDYADVEPSGDGPWPYWVLVSPDGLKVRTSGDHDGKQIGTAANENTVWAECRIETDFDPPSRNDVGPIWLRIRWPNEEVGTSQFFNSEPNAPHRGYVYLGYTVPAGHNGAIPPCD
jgi:hypothetical protein